MKLFAVLLLFMIGAMYALLLTTDKVLNQTQQLSTTYQYVSTHAYNIATGEPESNEQ